MNVKYVLLLFVILSVSACVSVPIQRATMLPTKDGRDRFAVSGLVKVSEVTEGVTKPHIEKGMAQTCPIGLEYESLQEILNKRTPFGTWMQWSATVICL